MVGDAIRTPVLQQIIRDIYGKDISKTLAPDECHARGATLYVIKINKI
jgi:molecular chaperone DnaK (HSP70)